MPDARLEAAKNQASSGKLREAISLVKAILQENPQDNEARAFMIELQDRMMLDLQVQDRLQKVQGLLEQGQRDQARKLLGEILRVAPENREAQILLRGLEQGQLAPTPPPAEFSDFAAPPLPAPAEFASFEAESLPPLKATPAPMAFQGDTLEELQPFEAPAPARRAREQASEISFDTFELDNQEPSTAERMQLHPAGAQLGQAEMAKVQQYLNEGHAFFAQGRYKEAIEVWTRIYIVDENNAEAQDLIDQAKQKLNVHQMEIEHLLTEGIGAFNVQDYGKARQFLEKILFTFPGHREAQYYLGRVGELEAQRAAAKAIPATVEFQAAAPTQPPAPEVPPGKAEAPSFGGEFELDDDLTVPTGPEMRADGPPPEVGFQFESKPDEFSFASLSPEGAPPEPEPAPSAFSWDEAPTAPPVTDLFAPSTGFAAAPAPAEPSPFFTPPAPATVSEAPAFEPPPTMEAPPAPGVPVDRPRPEAAKPSKGGPSMAVLGGIAVAVVVLGLGTFIGARFLFRSPEPPPIPVEVPKPKPKPVPKPNQPANDAGQPNTTPPGSGDDPKALNVDQLLAKAKEASAAKDFKKAIAFYQEILLRDAVNPQALQGLSGARTALNLQEQENARNEKFLRDYQSAVNAFQEQDYAESLRISWRMIYPDDTLARQLGKREALTALIKAGYYNWAVMNLKSENLNDAEKNLKDLLEFEKGDADGQKLMQFIKRTRAQGGVDQTYREAVRNIPYRSFSESP